MLSTVPWGEFDEYVPTELTRDLESVENGVPFWWMKLISTTTTMSIEFWDRLFEAAGFDVEWKERYVFRPNDPEVAVDRQYWVIARKREERNACLGPWPIPKSAEGNGPVGVAKFEHRIVGLEDLMQKGRKGKSGEDGSVLLYSLPELNVPAGNVNDKTVITLVQHAPENEVLNLLYEVHLPGMPIPIHQGYLLQNAQKGLTTFGFTEFNFEVKDAFIDWRDVAEDARIETAACDIAEWMWPQEPQLEQVKKAVIEHLKVYWSRGKDRGEDWDGRLGFAAVVMTARKSTQ